MKKTETKRLAKDMAASYLRGLLDVEAIENGLEMHSLCLSEEEIKILEAEIQAIIERLGK